MQIIFESDSEMVDYILTREDLVESVIRRYEPSEVARFLQKKYYQNIPYHYSDKQWNEMLEGYIFEFEKVIERIKQFIK